MSSLERADGPRVSDVAENLNRIRVPLSGIERSERQGPYRYYGAQGVIDHIDDYLFDGEYVLVAEDGENLRSRKQPIAFLVSGRFWVNNHAHILKVNGEVANRRYVVNAINQASLAGLVTGAAQPKLTKANLERLHLPPLSRAEQDRVAAVLAAFDKLIEINQRRIELLEDLARSLYREWFVRFRFPGRRTPDGSGEGLPPGCVDASRLDQVAQLVMGQSPRSEFYNAEGVGHPFHQGVSDYGALIPVHRTFSTQGPRRAEAGDVLCSVRAPVGRLNLADRDLIVGRGLAAIRRFDGRTGLLLEQLRVGLGDEDSIGGGTIFKAVGKDELAALSVSEPIEPLRAAFETAARPMLDERVSLTLMNRAVTSTRDLLLPRLVTGRLDISDVDLGGLPPDAEAE